MGIKVSIIEDKKDIATGLAYAINKDPAFNVALIYNSAERFLQEIEDAVPDIAIMDISLGNISGIECTRMVKARFPDVDILMFTVYEDVDSIFNSLKAGATGYITKGAFPSEILEYLKELVKGGAPMTPSIARKVVSSFNKSHDKDYQLTNRESEILQLLAKGNSYNSISDELEISFNTVHFHLKNIYRKLHVRSRYEAVKKYTDLCP